MGVEVDTRPLREELEGMSQEVAEEAAGRAFSESQQVLLRAGDEEEYEVYPVVQAARPPEWDDSRQAYVFRYPHPASVFFEVGTEPHEIQGNPVLAFEWPEMKGEQFGDTGQTFEEVYEDTWPTVFLPATDHPGTPALRYLEAGMREAERWLEGQT